MIGYDTVKLYDDHAADLTPEDHIARRQARRRARELRKQLTPPPGTLPTLAQVAATDLFLVAFDEMSRSGGPAPGPDGVRYGDCSRSEVARAHREVVAPAIKDGTYRPGPYRPV